MRAAVLANYPAKQADSDPSIAWELDKHRANLLSKLGAPEAVTVAVALLERPETSAPQAVDAALLARRASTGLLGWAPKQLTLEGLMLFKV